MTPGVRVRQQRRSDPFYVWMAATLLLINIAGFAPTFFLKSFFDEPALPLRTHLHGLLFTSWFVLLLLQSVLIRRHAVRHHRRLGLAGAGLAVAMVVSGLVILYFGVEEFRDAGGSVVRASQFLWGNLALLSAFAVFVSLAIAYRTRPAAHKRLMLLASLAMMAQSLGRMGRFLAVQFQLGGSPELGEAVFGLGGLAALLVVMVIHDKIVARQVHPAVAWGAPLLLGGILFAAMVLPSTSFGQSLARALY
jgi:uncharacterized membrane protein YozB (DUF420 family)